MEIQKKRDMNDHYLVLSDHENEALNSYQTRMINENEIGGLLACHVERIDDVVIFFYNVTSRQSLAELITDYPVDCRLLRTILEALVDTFRGLGEYLLPEGGLLLDPECIYADSLLCDIRFCYFPGKAESLEADLRQFGEFLLPRLDHDDMEVVLLGYSFYRMCMNGELTENRLCELLYSERNEIARRRDGRNAAETEDSRIEESVDGRNSAEAGSGWNAARSRMDPSDQLLQETDSESEKESAVRGEKITSSKRRRWKAASGTDESEKKRSRSDRKSRRGTRRFGKAEDEAMSAEFSAEENPMDEEQRRQIILDDFFSGSEEMEEEETDRKGRAFLVLAVIAAVSVAAGLILTGQRDKGIGIGVLIFSGAVLLQRIIGKLSERPEQKRDFLYEDGGRNASFDGYDPDGEVFEFTGEDEVREKRGKHLASSRGSVIKSSQKAKRSNAFRISEGSLEFSAGGATEEQEDECRSACSDIRARLISEDHDYEPIHFLRDDEYRIGSSAVASNLVLRSDEVSRLHAKLIWDGTHYMLRDMRSKHATLLNGSLIGSGMDVILHDGDCCRFADCSYRYRTGAMDKDFGSNPSKR
jgi:hypothetical protein